MLFKSECSRTGILAAANFTRMVQKNISTALILEDDADWDIRIKSQMHSFARGANLLLQPLSSNPSQYADPSYPNPKNAGEGYVDLDVSNAPSTTPPSWSPYGDHWDLLWIGHCGDKFSTEEKIPRGRALIHDDPTVISAEKFDPIFGDREVFEKYPPHTRVVAHHSAAVCTMGYAVTNAAARRILYLFGVQELKDPWDMALQKYCNGGLSGKVRNCLSPFPMLISRHNPVGRWGTFSDIGENPDDTNENTTPFSHNIRMAARVNLPKFVNEETDFIDSYPDES
jgi:GR25 family glycosyltransferase involved in LPS biosynthesis